MPAPDGECAVRDCLGAPRLRPAPPLHPRPSSCTAGDPGDSHARRSLDLRAGSAGGPFARGAPAPGRGCRRRSAASCPPLPPAAWRADTRRIPCRLAAAALTRSDKLPVRGGGGCLVFAARAIISRYMLIMSTPRSSRRRARNHRSGELTRTADRLPRDRRSRALARRTSAGTPSADPDDARDGSRYRATRCGAADRARSRRPRAGASE